MVGLDICGVDVVCDNVLAAAGRAGRRHRRGQCRARPAHAPRAVLRQGPRGRRGDHRPRMFADGDDGRIPVVAVTGTNGKTTTVAPDRRICSSSNGLRVGMTNTDGVYIARPAHRHRRLQRPEERAQRAAAPGRRRRRVRDRARRHAARRPGLRPLRRRGRHQHRHRRPPGPELHHHGRGPGGASSASSSQNVAPNGTAVLNAADPIVAAHGAAPARARSSSSPPTGTHPVLATHRAQGQRVVYVDDDADRRRRRHASSTASRCAEIPLTRNGTHRLPGRERHGRDRPPPGRSGIDWDVDPRAAWPASSTMPTTRPAASTSSTTAAPR